VEIMGYFPMMKEGSWFQIRIIGWWFYGKSSLATMF
jgi:hypothetical protein